MKKSSILQLSLSYHLLRSTRYQVLIYLLLIYLFFMYLFIFYSKYISIFLFVYLLIYFKIAFYIVIYFLFTFFNLYFERSEFRIDTSQKKSLRVCPCAWRPRVRLILVLVWGRQTFYGQNTVYLYLSKYIVLKTHTRSTIITLSNVRVTTATAYSAPNRTGQTGQAPLFVQ